MTRLSSLFGSSGDILLRTVGEVARVRVVCHYAFDIEILSYDKTYRLIAFECDLDSTFEDRMLKTARRTYLERLYPNKTHHDVLENPLHHTVSLP